jgi:hypothetical protein
MILMGHLCKRIFFPKKTNSIELLIIILFHNTWKRSNKIQWVEKMIENKKHILFFFFFLQNFYNPIVGILNVVKKPFVKTDQTVIQASQPPLETILIKGKDDTVVGRWRWVCVENNSNNKYDAVDRVIRR